MDPQAEFAGALRQHTAGRHARGFTCWTQAGGKTAEIEAPRTLRFESGTLLREIPGHVMALNEQHLRRSSRDSVDYHHDDRIHDLLEKETPNGRTVKQKPPHGEIKPASGRRSPLPFLARRGAGPPCIFQTVTLSSMVGGWSRELSTRQGGSLHPPERHPEHPAAGPVVSWLHRRHRLAVPAPSGAR